MKRAFIVALSVIALVVAGCGEMSVEPTENSLLQTERLEETIEISEEPPKESDEPSGEEASFNTEVLIFELTDSGDACSVKGILDGNYETVEIPAEHDGKPVTEISAEAFKSVKITKIVIPLSVVKIGARAFDGTGLSQAEFKEPEGWSAGNGNFKTSIIEDEKSAAIYLRQTFAGHEWTRK